MLKIRNDQVNEKQKRAKKFVSSFFVSSLIAFGLFTGLNVQAATSYFAPSAGSYTVGNIFTVSVSINTKGADINNAEGAIRFPSDLLEVVSVSRSGSIFSLWVEEPNFSNSAGTISFNGGLPTPGYNGASGKVFSAVFRAKKVGTASLLFSSASILANDGLGTNVFSGSGSANYDLIVAGETKPDASKVPKAEEPSGLPSVPRVSSPTHPDQSQWYTNSDPRFVWPVPSGITAVRFSYDDNPVARPTVTYQSPISERALAGIGNGVWYSHVQFSNDKGLGGVAHFRFQIDSDKPSFFEITEVPVKEFVGAKAEFIFDAKDDRSGIDHYEVQIDSREPEIWRDDGSHRYVTPELNPGKYTLNVKAFDKAGNSVVAAMAFEIQGLQPPSIIEYPNEISASEAFVVRGATNANSEVIVWLQKDKEDAKSFSIQSGKDGAFIFVVDKGLMEGAYTVWTEVVDNQGLKSEPSEKMSVRVTARTGSCVNNTSIFVLPLLALVSLLALALWYVWYRSFTLKRRIKKEVSEAKAALNEAFDLLKKEVREQVKMFEKTKTRRELTDEEERVIKQMKRQLDGAEKSVKKEIEDIDKVLR